MHSEINRFDAAAAEWDAKPSRVELARKIGEAIVREVRPGGDMDLLDYGCGTGLLTLYLLPHVRSAVGADSSAGMLDVLNKKIAQANFDNLRTMALDLERNAPPAACCHLLTTAMTMHHVADIPKALAGFFTMLHPGGTLAVADLDTESGDFHAPDNNAAGVRHFGFDRQWFKEQLVRAGFSDPRDVTAHVIHKEITYTGRYGDFPIFLITARKTRQ